MYRYLNSPITQVLHHMNTLKDQQNLTKTLPWSSAKLLALCQWPQAKKKQRLHSLFPLSSTLVRTEYVLTPDIFREGRISDKLFSSQVELLGAIEMLEK